jgi:hypothetical protein
MAICGKRMSVYSEGESSDKIEMNSAGLKQVSGEDSLCGRELYGNQITFTPYTKLHMLTNFTPPLNAEFSIAMHYETFQLASEKFEDPANEIRKFQKENNINNKFLLMEVAENKEF